MTQYWYPCGEGWTGLCGDSKNALVMNEEKKNPLGMPFYPFSAWSAALASTFTNTVCGCLSKTCLSVVFHKFHKIVRAVKFILCYSPAFNNVSRVKTPVCRNDSCLTCAQNQGCSPKISAQVSLLGLAGHSILLSINRLRVNTREGEELQKSCLVQEQIGIN